MHRYLYAGADPINRADPSGREEVDYVITLNRSLKAAPILAAAGCGAQLFLMYDFGVVEESFRDPIADFYLGAGCAQTIVSLEGSLGPLTADTIGVAACADGMIEMAEDMDAAVARPTEENEKKVNFDFISGTTGCMIGLIALAAE